jgi:two-component system response regulator HydG
VLELLLDYRWPGNVRELAHLIERLVLLGHDAEVGRDDLPDAIRDAEAPAGLAFGDAVLPVRELQQRYAVWALAQCGGQRGRTAEKLGIDPKTLSKWLEEAQPSPPARRTQP